MNTEPVATDPGPARPLARPGRWRTGWFLLLALEGVGALALGFHGFLPPVSPDVGEAFYRALQLLALNFPDLRPGGGYPLPWTLQAGRFLAAAFTFSAAVRLAAEVFREQIIGLRLRSLRGHAIVCGLGREGRQLVAEYRREGVPVVAIERRGDDEDIADCRAQGAFVIVGNAARRETLEQAGIRRAGTLVAVCDRDDTNLAIAAQAHRLLGDRPRPGGEGALCAVVYLADLSLLGLLREDTLFRGRGEALELHFLNFGQALAEKLARLVLPPTTPAASAMVPGGRMRLVLAGFGEAARDLAVETARRAADTAGLRLEVAVLDAEADRRAEEFRGRLPAFEEVAGIRFSPVEKGGEAAAIAEQLRADATEGGGGCPFTLTSVVLCGEDERENLATALRLRTLAARGECPAAGLLVRVVSADGLGELAGACREELTRQGITFFGAGGTVRLRDALPTGQVEAIAREIHARYCHHQEATLGLDAAAGQPAMRPWAKLDEGYKASNRRQAGHIAHKLRVIGRAAVPRGGSDFPAAEPSFSPDEVEILARLEHVRWCAERWLAGWRLGTPRNDAHRFHPDLVPWEGLSETTREKDRQSVRELPRLLRLAGLRLGAAARGQDSPAERVAPPQRETPDPGRKPKA